MPAISRICRAAFNERLRISRGSLVFLIHAACDDPDRIILQRPLQRLGLIPRRTHPNIALLISHQDDRHGLRVNRIDNGVRRCCEKAVDVVRSRDRLGLRSPVAFELGPDTGEGRQGAVIIQGEPTPINNPGFDERLVEILDAMLKGEDRLGELMQAVLRLRCATANALQC
jgi:hypothetical protein